MLTRLRDRYRVVAAVWHPVAADVLATLSMDGRITVWQLRLDQPPVQWLSVRSPAPGAAAMAWLPEGRFLACAGDDGAVSVWNVDTVVRHAQVLGRPSQCVALHAAADDTLHAAYQDGTVRRTSPLLQPGRPRSQRFPPITAAAWSPSGETLAVAHHGGFFEVHDRDLYVRWTGQVATDAPLILAWHQDNAVVVADRAARTLTAFDTTGTVLWKQHVAPEPSAMSITGDLLAVGCVNYAPLFVDLTTGTLLAG
ncbi:WD40 repeat domain-containing protein [Paractinoplanes durhamensis]|uniref:WD40 repeat domain-containing protein n=1 Tax=Paractinoplanes durhamensis TaxID=113563 RepID=UPI001941B855|nr:WD40 repeat domain-containing protein [Actinoplanes durhamensis]